jgi:large subunit ribosomal protein L21
MPTVSDILVKAMVVEHIKGPKVVRFKYRPKKRIRVKGGHRHQYTRLMIDFIGRPDEDRKVEKPVAQQETEEEVVEEVEVKKEPKPAKQAKGSAKTATKKSATSKSSTKSTTKKTGKK